MSRYEQDDKGVMCYYNAENEEWLTTECSCVTCGYRDIECVCDDDERDWRDPEFDINEASHEEVYQVRINGGDKGFIGGDMECIDDCWRAINDYHYKNNGVDKGDEISITLTPLLSEDILEELGLEYNIRVLYTIRPKNG